MPRQAKKCPECNGCMGALYAPDGLRYFYCAFCRTYYGGGPGEVSLVPSPFVPQEIKDVDEEIP